MTCQFCADSPEAKRRAALREEFMQSDFYGKDVSIPTDGKDQIYRFVNGDVVMLSPEGTKAERASRHEAPVVVKRKRTPKKAAVR